MPLRKIIAAGLSVLLFVSNGVLCHAEETNFWKQRQRSLQLASVVPMVERQIPSAVPSALDRNLPPLQRIDIGDERKRVAVPDSFKTLLERLPCSLGSVRRVSHPASGPSENVIVLVQDVHMNHEAQQNISSVVTSLSEKKLLDFIALEGSSATIDVTPQRRTEPKIRQSVADFLLRTDKISGAVHAALTMPSAPPRVRGIEQQNLYNENVNAYLVSSPLAARYQRQLHDVERLLLRMSDRVSNLSLRSYIALSRRYEQQQMSMSSYVSELSRFAPLSPALSRFLDASELETTIDYQKVGAERAALLNALSLALTREETATLVEKALAYRLSSIDAPAFYEHVRKLTERKRIALKNYPELERYIRYVSAAAGIDGEGLFAALHAQEETVAHRLAMSVDERHIVDQLKLNRYLQKLLTFELTAEEWSDYQRLKQQAAMPPLEHIDAFEAFYETAKKRDTAMTENVAQCRRHAGTTGLLVVGGFHAQGMISKLNDAGFTTISFVPTISKVDAATGSEYLSVFAQEKTPLEKLAFGEKLFLARDPAYGLPLFGYLADTEKIVLAAAPSTSGENVIPTKGGTVQVDMRLRTDAAHPENAPEIVEVTSRAYWSLPSLGLKGLADLRSGRLLLLLSSVAMKVLFAVSPLLLLGASIAFLGWIVSIHLDGSQTFALVTTKIVETAAHFWLPLAATFIGAVGIGWMWRYYYRLGLDELRSIRRRPIESSRSQAIVIPVASPAKVTARARVTPSVQIPLRLPVANERVRADKFKRRRSRTRIHSLEGVEQRELMAGSILGQLQPQVDAVKPAVLTGTFNLDDAIGNPQTEVKVHFYGLPPEVQQVQVELIDGAGKDVDDTTLTLVNDEALVDLTPAEQPGPVQTVMGMDVTLPVAVDQSAFAFVESVADSPGQNNDIARDEGNVAILNNRVINDDFADPTRETITEEKFGYNDNNQLASRETTVVDAQGHLASETLTYSYDTTGLLSSVVSSNPDKKFVVQNGRVSFFTVVDSAGNVSEKGDFLYNVDGSQEQVIFDERQTYLGNLTPDQLIQNGFDPDEVRVLDSRGLVIREQFNTFDGAPNASATQVEDISYAHEVVPVAPFNGNGNVVTNSNTKVVAPFTAHVKFRLGSNLTTLRIDATASVIAPGTDATYVITKPDGTVLYEFEGTNKPEPVILFNVKGLAVGMPLTLTITVKYGDGTSVSNSSTDILVIKTNIRVGRSGGGHRPLDLFVNFHKIIRQFSVYFNGTHKGSIDSAIRWYPTDFFAPSNSSSVYKWWKSIGGKTAARFSNIHRGTAFGPQVITAPVFPGSTRGGAVMDEAEIEDAPPQPTPELPSSPILEAENTPVRGGENHNPNNDRAPPESTIQEELISTPIGKDAPADGGVPSLDLPSSPINAVTPTSPPSEFDAYPYALGLLLYCIWIFWPREKKDDHHDNSANATSDENSSLEKAATAENDRVDGAAVSPNKISGRAESSWWKNPLIVFVGVAAVAAIAMNKESPVGMGGGWINWVLKSAGVLGALLIAHGVVRWALRKKKRASGSEFSQSLMVDDLYPSRIDRRPEPDRTAGPRSEPNVVHQTIGGVIVLRDDAVERVVYGRHTDELSLEQQVRYRYTKKGRHGTITTTTVDNNLNQASKISLEYQYENGLLSGFTTRNKLLNGFFVTPDDAAPPTRLFVTNMELQLCATISIRYPSEKNIALLEIQYEPGHIAPTSDMVAVPGKEGMWTLRKEVRLNSNAPHDTQLRRRVFNAASKGIVANLEGKSAGALSGTYSHHDEKGRPTRLDVDMQMADGTLTKRNVVLMTYGENGELTESVYYSRGRLTPDQVIEGKFPEDEIRWSTKPFFEEKLLARALTKSEVRKFDKDGHLISRTLRDYTLDETPSHGSVGAEIESPDDDADEQDAQKPDAANADQNRFDAGPQHASSEEPTEHAPVPESSPQIVAPTLKPQKFSTWHKYDPDIWRPWLRILILWATLSFGDWIETTRARWVAPNGETKNKDAAIKKLQQRHGRLQGELEQLLAADVDIADVRVKSDISKRELQKAPKTIVDAPDTALVRRRLGDDGLPTYELVAPSVFLLRAFIANRKRQRLVVPGHQRALDVLAMHAHYSNRLWQQLKDNSISDPALKAALANGAALKDYGLLRHEETGSVDYRRLHAEDFEFIDGKRTISGMKAGDVILGAKGLQLLASEVPAAARLPFLQEDVQRQMRKLSPQQRRSAVGFVENPATRQHYVLTLQHALRVRRFKDLSLLQRVKSSIPLSQWQPDDLVLLYKGELCRVQSLIRFENRDAEIRALSQQAYRQSKRVNALRAALNPVQRQISDMQRQGWPAWLLSSLDRARRGAAFIQRIVGELYGRFQKTTTYQNWAKAYGIVSEHYVFNEKFSVLQRAAITEEIDIATGKVNRMDWLLSYHASGPPWIFLVLLTMTIWMAKLAVGGVLFAFPNARRQVSMTAAIWLHTTFSYVWWLLIRPIEILLKTILFRLYCAVQTGGEKIKAHARPIAAVVLLVAAALAFVVEKPWILPAKADYRAQTARSELKFGIPEGPLVQMVINALLEHMEYDPMFLEKKAKYPLGYPVCSAYYDDDQWSLVQERENLFNNRVKPRDRRYNAGDETTWRETKNTEGKARKKKRFETDDDYNDLVDAHRFDPRIFVDPEDMNWAYLDDWFKLTDGMRRRIIVRYWRMAFEEKKRYGLKKEAGLRINLDFGVCYKLYNELMDGKNFSATGLEHFFLTYYGYLKPNTGTRIFEIKYPGEAPPAWVMRLVYELNLKSADQIVEAGYSKFGDSAIRGETSVKLKPGDKRLEGEGEPFLTFARNNPHFVYDNPDLPEPANKKNKEKNKNKKGSKLRIVGPYDDVWDDPFWKQREQEAEKEHEVTVRADKPMNPGFLQDQGAFIATRRYHPGKYRPVKPMNLPGPVEGPAPLKAWKAPFFYMRMLAPKIVLFALPFVFTGIWVSLSAPSMSLMEIASLMLSRGTVEIPLYRALMVGFGALGSGIWISLVYNKTYARPGYNKTIPINLPEFAVVVAFSMLLMQQHLLLGTILMVIFAVFGWKVNNRAPSELMSVSASMVCGFIASVTTDVHSWSVLMVFLLVFTLIKYMGFWITKYADKRADPFVGKIFKQKFGERKFDYIIHLTYIGRDPKADTEVLENVLRAYVGKKSDFIVGTDEEGQLRASMAFDLIDAIGSNPSKAGLRGFGRELRRRMPGRFEWSLDNQVGSMRDWFVPRFVAAAVALFVFGQGQTVFASSPGATLPGGAFDFFVGIIIVALVSWAVGYVIRQFFPARTRTSRAPPSPVLSKTERIDRMTELLRETIEHLREEGRIDGENLSALIGTEMRGVSSADRATLVAAASDQSIAREAVQRVLQQPGVALLDPYEIQAALKVLLLAPRRQSAAATNLDEIIPVTIEDKPSIEQLLVERPDQRVALMIDKDMDVSSKEFFQSLETLHPTRVHVVMSDDNAPPLFSISAGRRTLQLSAFAQCLQQVPPVERSHFRIALSLDLQLSASNELNFENTILSQFEFAFIDQMNRLIDVPFATLETMVRATRQEQSNA